MTTRLSRLCAALAPLLLLAACRSVPTRDYTLLPDTVAPVSASTAGHAAFAIAVAPVRVPDQVDTRALVLRASEARLQVQDAHEWAAPLADEIRQALSQRLTALLKVPDVAGLPRPASLPVYRVRVVVTRFDSRYGVDAAVAARWTIEAPVGHRPTVLLCVDAARQAVASGYTALVEGHQRALAALAGRIAAGVTRLRRGKTGCP